MYWEAIVLILLILLIIIMNKREKMTKSKVNQSSDFVNLHDFSTSDYSNLKSLNTKLNDIDNIRQSKSNCKKINDINDLSQNPSIQRYGNTVAIPGLNPTPASSVSNYFMTNSVEGSMATIGLMDLSQAVNPIFERIINNNVYLNKHKKLEPTELIYQDDMLFRQPVNNFHLDITQIRIIGCSPSNVRIHTLMGDERIIESIEFASYDRVLIMLYSYDTFIVGALVEPKGYYQYIPNYNYFYKKYENKPINHITFNEYDLQLIDNDVINVKKNNSKMISKVEIMKF